MKKSWLLFAVASSLFSPVRLTATPPSGIDAVIQQNYNGVVAVAVQVVVKPGRDEELKALLPALRQGVASEDGNIDFSVSQSLEDPTHFVFYGEWGHINAFIAHTQAPHAKAFLAKAQDLLAAPPSLSFHRRLK